MKRTRFFIDEWPLNTKPTKEDLLWWAVIQQAAEDLDTGYEQLALDAYEFLSTTGLWLLIDHFMMDEDTVIKEISKLVRTYNVRSSRPLPIAGVESHVRSVSGSDLG